LKWYFVKRYGILRDIGNEGNKTLTIKSVQVSHTGTYMCYGNTTGNGTFLSRANIAIIGKQGHKMQSAF